MPYVKKDIMKMNRGRRHHVTSSVKNISLDNWGKIIWNIVLKNGLPLDFYFVQKTSTIWGQSDPLWSQTYHPCHTLAWGQYTPAINSLNKIRLDPVHWSVQRLADPPPQAVTSLTHLSVTSSPEGTRQGGQIWSPIWSVWYRMSQTWDF